MIGQSAYLENGMTFDETPTVTSDVVPTSLTDVFHAKQKQSEEHIALWDVTSSNEKKLNHVNFKRDDGTDSDSIYEKPVVSVSNIVLKPEGVNGLKAQKPVNVVNDIENPLKDKFYESTTET